MIALSDMIAKVGTRHKYPCRIGIDKADLSSLGDHRITHRRSLAQPHSKLFHYIQHAVKKLLTILLCDTHTHAHFYHKCLCPPAVEGMSKC